jgi:hypothetical protein
MVKKHCLVFVGALALSAAAPVMAQEVYLQGGTQGVGVGAAFGLSSWLGVHADVDGFGLSHNFHAGQNEFAAHLSLRQGGAYLDLFPFSGSGFRLTGGVLLNDDELSGDAVPTNGTYNFNGQLVPAIPGQSAHLSVKYPTAMPYLGLGFGHKPSGKGFGVTADLGVAYGRPRVDFSVSPELAALAAANVAQEEGQIRDSIEHYQFYPILQIGVSYRF